MELHANERMRTLRNERAKLFSKLAPSFELIRRKRSIVRVNLSG